METLKKWMTAEGISQAQLARDMAVSQPTVSDWLSGKVVPKVEHLLRLRTLTGITIDGLLDLEPLAAAA